MKWTTIRNKLIFALLIFFLIILFSFGIRGFLKGKTPKQPDGLLKGEVTRVIDGDTFMFKESSGEEIKVRLIGVDAPESVNPDKEKNTKEGDLASEHTKKALEGKIVYLEFDIKAKDNYDRYLAYVWIDGELFNKKILKDGHAVLLTIVPNIKYVDYLVMVN